MDTTCQLIKLARNLFDWLPKRAIPFTEQIEANGGELERAFSLKCAPDFIGLF